MPSDALALLLTYRSICNTGIPHSLVGSSVFTFSLYVELRVLNLRNIFLIIIRFFKVISSVIFTITFCLFFSDSHPTELSYKVIKK